MIRVHDPRTFVCLASLTGAANVCHAQPIETLTLSIVWDKPVIAPGETNTGQVLATVGPTIGTLMAWNTKPGTGQTGTLKAFASAIFDIKNQQNGTNGLFSVTIPSEFMISNMPISGDGNGGFVKLPAGQLSPPSNQNPNTNQTVSILNFSWKASSGPGGYEVVYGTKATSAKVYLDVGMIAWVGENAIKVDGQGGFMVIPGPGMAATLVLACTAAIRRRRIS